MSTNRTYTRRPHRSRLSPDAELDLWLGSKRRQDDPPFASEEARRQAWERHRDRLLGVLPSSPGKRPQAWWRYESPIPWPGIDRERSALWRAGVLGEAEKAALEAEWRHWFDRAQKPDFMLCMGPGSGPGDAQWLEGARARRAHYRWADIPPELVKQWTEERRQTIRRLKQTAELGLDTQKEPRARLSPDAG